MAQMKASMNGAEGRLSDKMEENKLWVICCNDGSRSICTHHWMLRTEMAGGFVGWESEQKARGIIKEVESGSGFDCEGVGKSVIPFVAQ